MEIEVKQQDIISYVYFVSSMAQQTTNGMFGSLSSKSDLIGGIFDRWINIIPESVSFNQYFLPKALQQIRENKTVRVFSDFYMYDPKEVGIAPDVIGLKINDKIVPFVKYDDTQEKKCFWVAQDGCPQIEVKSFFGRKYMVSLRDQHYGDKFLVMIGARIDVDYLLSFFNSQIFNEEQTTKLHMPNDFIVSDTKGLLSQTKPVEFNRSTLGKIEILTVTTATEFKNVALKLLGGEIPRYFVDVTERSTLVKEEARKYNQPLSYYCDVQESGLYRFNTNWYELFNTANEKTLDIEITNPNALKVIKKTNNAITVIAEEDVFVNGYKLEKDKQYNINFATFGAIAGEEYFINRGLLHHLPNKEAELITSLADIIKNN